MCEIDELLPLTTSAFSFLEARGFAIASQETVFPTSFKGGFVVGYRSIDEDLRLQYLDMELSVTLGSTELFGCNHHPGFGGNMFSRSNLRRYLPQLAEAVKASMDGSSKG